MKYQPWKISRIAKNKNSELEKIAKSSIFRDSICKIPGCEYLDSIQSWITVTGEGEGNDESDKHL